MERTMPLSSLLSFAKRKSDSVKILKQNAVSNNTFIYHHYQSKLVNKYKLLEELEHSANSAEHDVF